MRLWTKLETKLLVAVIAATSGAGVIMHWIAPEWVAPVMLVVSAAAVTWLVLSTRRRITVWLEYERKQTQALVNLHAMLPIRAPLPPMTSWAATPEFVALVLEKIALAALRRRADSSDAPITIVECGSGVSTLLSAYALEVYGAGRVFSLDHDDEFAAITEERLALHGLTEAAEIIRAPIGRQTLGNVSWPWYDTSNLSITSPIDLLVVDGPPESTAPQARYPAFPVFRERLADEAWILLDDAARPDERSIVARWLAESDGELEEYFIDGPKGASVLTFRRRGT